MSKDKVCYLYECIKYPHCTRAVGKSCMIKDTGDEEDEVVVTIEECNAENEYPLFIDDGRTFNPHSN